MEDELKQIGFYTLEDYRARNVSAESPMWRCEIILTEYCNFNCPYCRGLDSSIYGTRKIKQLSIEEVKNVIDIWCKNKPLKNIRFSGGEPTLYPHIREVVRYAKEKGVERIAVSSNGSNNLTLYKELIEDGVNDFSISLDACCAEDGDKMAGGIKGAFGKVISNIKEISKLTYVTVGVVFTPQNIDRCIDTIRFAHNLGVSDIRIISAAQWNEPIPRLKEVEQEILDSHPILKYRVNNFKKGRNVRGIKKSDCSKCHLMIDDSVVAGDFHFPCVIYMREGGKPIGRVGKDMRKERIEFLKNHNAYEDKICRNNCLDVCQDYNARYDMLRKKAIYKITNIENNKIYIGKTIHYNSNYWGSGKLIKRAIRKYGISSFIKETIDYAETVTELNNKEKYWIKYYNSTNLALGYNISKGGDGGDMFSNNPNKENIRKRCSDRCRGEKNPMYGKKHSKKSIKKISKHRKGKRKGISTWNAGISIKGYSEKYKKYLSNIHGKNNPSAKKFIFVSPQDKEYIVIGNFENFCNEYKLNVGMARHFINRGRIPKPQKGKPKIRRINLIGWEIKCKK